jgi:ribosomal protein L11 methyltransferase
MSMSMMTINKSKPKKIAIGKVPSPTGPSLFALVFQSLKALPAPQADQIAECLTDRTLFESPAYASSFEIISDDGGWNFRGWYHQKPDLKSIQKLLLQKFKLKLSPANFTVTEEKSDQNWLELSYQQFPPLTIGSFYIYGSHLKKPEPKKGQIPLKIDAATAFGSGKHGTTEGCLLALERLKKQGVKPKSILDMGTGSGILALAAYQLWRKPTLAIDHDHESVKVACRHRRLNAVPSGDAGVVCANGDGYKARRVQAQSAFDLVIANILAAPLIEMAPELVAKLHKKSWVVLSGLLITQEKDVLKAHQKLGLKKKFVLHKGEWSTLVLGF